MTEHAGREGVRLNKFLAERLGISRREADQKIEAGAVTINGQTAQIGNRVDKNDKVCYNNREVPAAVEFVYYAFHKPVGYVCSRSRQGKDPTIYEILPPHMRKLKNVGRLDRLSSGVLLLTNDGDLAYELTHPQFVKQKVYEVTLQKPLSPQDRRQITEEGVEIADGLSRFKVEDNPHFDASDGKHLIVTLTEGRNRQIRRTFAALGYNVVTLHRTKFGDYELGDLKPGQWRKIAK